MRLHNGDSDLDSDAASSHFDQDTNSNNIVQDPDTDKEEWCDTDKLFDHEDRSSEDEEHIPMPTGGWSMGSPVKEAEIVEIIPLAIQIPSGAQSVRRWKERQSSRGQRRKQQSMILHIQLEQSQTWCQDPTSWSKLTFIYP